jgi:uncharacterized membrane-anchored protein YhcB (DUF1043 family)
MQADVNAVPVIWRLIDKALIGLAITGIGALIMWPLKTAQKEWTALKQSITDAHTELTQQRTNHLTHIENDGAKQVELLGKTTELLEGIRLDLREQTGFLQALSLSPRRVTARAKK